MDANDVAQFLRSHPEFFDQHPDLFESLTVPNPHGGRAIPLSERQLLTYRDKVKALEAKLGQLLQFGEENDAIGEKVHRLALALMGAPDAAAAAGALYYHLREDFSVPHVAMRVWGREWLAGAPEAQPVEPALVDQAETLGGPHCGPAEGNAFLPWLGEAQSHVRSVALVPLGQTRVAGLLVLGSEDPQRFFPEMGTLFLRRIGELAAGAILRT